MKRLIGVALILFLVVGCDVSTTTTKAKMDSTIKKIDSSLERVGERAEDAFDSTKLKVKELGKDLDSVFRKDSTN